MYYFLSEWDGALLDSRDKLPTMERLQEMANEFGCSFYVLQGEHTGISITARYALPPRDEPHYDYDTPGGYEQQ